MQSSLPIRLFLLVLIAVCTAHPVWSQDIKAQLDQAAALRHKGAFTEARNIYESVLHNLQGRPISHELGETLIGLSKIANAEGHYELAVAKGREAAEVYRKLGNNDGEARARNDAGVAFMNSGKYPEAAQELGSALRLNGQTGNAQAAISILNDLGSVYYYQSKYSESSAAYDEAMQRLERSQGESWARHWRQFTLLNIGALHQKLGNYQRALDVNKELEQSPEGFTQGELGHLYANLGVLYRRLGDPQKALDEYRKAQQAYLRKHDADGEIGVLKNTGIVLALDIGRFQDALRTFSSARALAEKAGDRREGMQSLLYRAETLYRMGRLQEAKTQFDAALAEASELGTVEEQWKALYALGQIAERLGEPALAETRYRDAISRIESMRSKIQLSRLKSGFLADKRDVYDRMIRLLLARNDTAAAFEYMERSRARVFQDSFHSGKVMSGEITLSSIQAHLDASTALIEFWVGPDAIAAIWITRDSSGIAQHQTSPAEMKAMIGNVEGFPENPGENWQADFQRLNALIPSELAPLRDDRYTHILIVPDSFLSLVPFELMAASAGQPLIEKHDVTYLPSAVLVSSGVFPQRGRFNFPWQRQLIAFGDPRVIAGSGAPLVLSDSRDVLPGSSEEIQQIARMSQGRSRVFVGDADRKQDFFDETRSGTFLLHVSTHAVADMDNPERSRLLFSPDKPGQPGNYLFLKELYDLDLHGVSLTTLSACDTERGHLTPGEGVQAFSRAILAAGSRSVVTTLWRVPDQPTADFMKQFYFFLLKKHKPKAEALRLAKLEFLHSGTALSHPRYWAAFVLNGEGAEPVPEFIPWQAMLIPIPVLALGVLGFLRLRKAKPRK
ncbi:MAG TPA: CHAT domain-containing protein [Candidatus Angelobacter sp.]|nr:CHAT domain-containing protein [Candidatus Angelobacter sp.]